MDLYTIIIVDDEDEIREGITKRIPWEEYGFSVVGSAENGAEALELTQKLQPNVLMTDIMMPFMDGLQLCEKVSRQLPSTKLIIFSGSDDLEYAHRAIKINVVEYVLKPVNAEDLKDTLTKLKIQLDQEYEGKRNLETLRQHYIDSLPVIRDQFLIGLADGRITKEQLQRNAGMAGLDIEAKGYTTAMIQIDKEFTDSHKNLFKNHDDALIPITIKNLLDEIMKQNYKIISFLYGEMIVLIIAIDSEEEIYDMIDRLDEVCREAKRIYDLIITCGIGTYCSNLLHVQYKRKEAQSALDYRFVLGTGKSIYIGDVEPDTTIQLQFQGEDERIIISAIKLGNHEELTQQVQIIFDRMQNVVLPLSQYRIYLMEIKVCLLRLIQTYHLDMKNIFADDNMEDDSLNFINSLDKAREWVLEKCILIGDWIKKERVNSSSLLVGNAKQYVADNYSDSELTVEGLSVKFHVSPTYFSTIFKRETGTTFIAYLTEHRLQIAIELLNTTDDKSYMIAEKVGYLEPNYFSYVFKKKFGVSPSRYRNKK